MTYKKKDKVVFADDDKLREGIVVAVWPGDDTNEDMYTIEYKKECERKESQIRGRKT